MTRELTLIYERREDGGMCIRSPNLRGFLLSHRNPFLVLSDLGPVLDVLLPLYLAEKERE